MMSKIIGEYKKWVIKFLIVMIIQQYFENMKRYENNEKLKTI